MEFPTRTFIALVFFTRIGSALHVPAPSVRSLSRFPMDSSTNRQWSTSGSNVMWWCTICSGLTFRLYSIGHVAWPGTLTRPSCMYTNTHTLLSHPPHPYGFDICVRCGQLAPFHHHPGLQATHLGRVSPSWPTSVSGTPPFSMDQD